MQKSPAGLSWSWRVRSGYTLAVYQGKGGEGGEEEEDEKKIPIIAGRKISTVNSLDLLIAHRSTRHIGFPVVFSPFVLFCRSKFLFLSYFRSRLYVRLSFVRSRSFTLPLSD